MTYTTAADPADSAVTLLTIGPVTFRVRGADRPGATVAPSWSSQIAQIAAGLELIPAAHHADIAPAEIRIATGAGGSSYNYAQDLIIIHDGRFTASFNQRSFQSLVHESGHSFDKRRHCTERFTREQSLGVERERIWVHGLGTPIANWQAGVSPTFPPARPPDDWDHFRAIDYRGRNRDRASGLPTPGESFAEGYMMVICRPTRAATPDVHVSFGWGDLDPAYAACSAGQRQSPIDVAAPKPAAFPGVAFRYQAEPYSISNTGHGIQLDATKSRSTIALDGTTYVLDQFHFHAPSEHTLNGRTHAMEMHIVHQSADGRAAVVAVFIDAGASNPAFDAITADLPKQKGQDVALEGEIDAADLLPAGKSTVYRYTGSLTTPPCTEGVTFTVYDRPISLSKEQIGAFTAIYDHNARPVQPLNGRDVRSGAAAPATP